MTTTNPLICKDLVFGYRTGLRPALNWQTEPGQFWAIIGDNGCGKTTLFRTILGQLSPLSGRVIIDGSRAYVAQLGELAATMPARVTDVVAIGLEHGLSGLKPFYALRNRRCIQSALEKFDLLGMKKRQFSELSQGEKQRVQLAQATVRDISLLLLDEATSGMDPRHAAESFRILSELVQTKSLCVAAISHSMVFHHDYITHVLAFTDDGFLMGPRDEVLSQIR